MSISIQNVCDDWNNNNPGYLASWEYALDDEAYTVRVTDVESVGLPDISAKAKIPANNTSIGSAVVGLTLDALKAGVLLYKEYEVII